MSHDAPHPAPSAFAAPVWSDAARQAAFTTWLTALVPLQALRPETLCSASADASFRRYFRIDSAHGSRIIMDAPPDKEDCRAFAHVAQLMHDAGLRVPDVLAWDEAHGFMLLSDLGTHTMLQVIQRDQLTQPQGLYLQAVDALIAWQLASRPDVLPVYDNALLRRELELFPDWYLAQHKGIVIDEAARHTLNVAFERITAHNLSWPSVYVHRDFMPRNLMLPNDAMSGPLGVLDFQDAVYGPITYDIASLMRDAFWSWDEDFCLDIIIRYWDKARQAGLPVGDDFGEFYQGVEWMGLQRHLKVAGIFTRLTLRDGKAQYLADTPRFIAYIRATCERYIQLKPLLRLVERAEGIAMPNVFGFGRA